MPSTPSTPAPPARGILSVSAEPGGEERQRHERQLPPSSLAEYVAHFWSVEWDVRRPKLAETLPHPTFHVVFERSSERGEQAEVAGVPRGRFTRRLSGEGYVFGVKFRPAMFQPLLGASASSLTGKLVPVSAVFGAAGEALADAVFAVDTLQARAEVVERWLAPLLEGLPRGAVMTQQGVRDVVETMASDRRLLRVEAVSELAGCDVRTLQRHFRQFVGVRPKWVILRYRLHEAAERLKSADAPSFAELATELGYADQAHFVHDFKKWVGRTPGDFAAAHAPNVR